MSIINYSASLSRALIALFGANLSLTGVLIESGLLLVTGALMTTIAIGQGIFSGKTKDAVPTTSWVVNMFILGFWLTMNAIGANLID